MPLIPIVDNFNHSLNLFMKSKAVLKYTKAQYNLFFLQSVCEMIEFKTNIASIVPYPGLNPNCASISTSFCSDHNSKRWFSTDVNYFERQLSKLIYLYNFFHH